MRRRTVRTVINLSTAVALLGAAATGALAATSAAACGMFCTTMAGWPGNCFDRYLARSLVPTS